MLSKTWILFERLYDWMPCVHTIQQCNHMSVEMFQSCMVWVFPPCFCAAYCVALCVRVFVCVKLWSYAHSGLHPSDCVQFQSHHIACSVSAGQGVCGTPGRDMGFGCDSGSTASSGHCFSWYFLYFKISVVSTVIMMWDISLNSETAIYNCLNWKSNWFKNTLQKMWRDNVSTTSRWFNFANNIS